MKDEVTRAMKIQSDERQRLESALTAANGLEKEKRILPADSADPGELLDLTLETIPYNEAVAHAYARVASQAGRLARASLDLARIVASEVPQLSQKQRDALQRAQEIVAGLDEPPSPDRAHATSPN